MGKDFKRICTTAASPSSSGHSGGNFSSHAGEHPGLCFFLSCKQPGDVAGFRDFFPSQPWPRRPNRLSTSCPFPQADPGWGYPPDSPTRLSGMPCPEQDSPCDPPANANLKVAAKKGDQI